MNIDFPTLAGLFSIVGSVIWVGWTVRERISKVEVSLERIETLLTSFAIRLERIEAEVKDIDNRVRKIEHE
jgi:hypothetical protein